jgi:hypothetical protein
MSIGFRYIYKVESEVCFKGVCSMVTKIIFGNLGGKVLIHNGFKYEKKTDKGQNLCIGVVGEKNAEQI